VRLAAYVLRELTAASGKKSKERSQVGRLIIGSRKSVAAECRVALLITRNDLYVPFNDRL